MLGIGGILTESVTSKIKASGGRYVHKLLNSTPENWRRINVLLEDQGTLGALAKVHAGDYRRLLQPKYEEAAAELLAGLGQIPHLVLVHEAVFGTPPPPSETAADVEDDSEWNDKIAREAFGDMDPQVQSSVNALFARHGVTVSTYKRNAEASVLATAFVGDLQDNLLFRIYVPSGRIYEEELSRLLGLFHHWLNAVRGANVRQGGYSTTGGRVIEFFGESTGLSSNAIGVEMAQFNEFLSLLDDSDAATAMLVGLGVPVGRVDALVTRYRRDARRVLLDARHERDRKMLEIQQQLEAELADEPLMVGSRELALLVGQLVPVSPLADPGISQGRQLASAAPSVTINSQVFHHVEGVVAQHLSGEVNFGTPLDEILKLIRESDDPQRRELEDAARQLADDGAPKPARIAARQTLKSFLFRTAGRLEASTYQLLWEWLQRQVGR